MPGCPATTADFDEAAATREIADWSRSPARLLEQKELQAQINRAVDSLAPEYRVVLVLREVDGLSYNEIAEVTGLTLEAVKTRLNRAQSDGAAESGAVPENIERRISRKYKGANVWLSGIKIGRK